MGELCLCALVRLCVSENYAMSDPLWPADSHHIVISNAALHADTHGPQAEAAWRDVLNRRALPHLARCLRSSRQQVLRGSATSLTPPHETALWRHTGADGFSDGLVSWAAMDAAQRGLDTGRAWAHVHLCHWDVSIDDITFTPLANTPVSAQQTGSFQAALSPYFEADGLQLHPCRPGVLLASGAWFEQLPTASVARAQGQRVADWWGEGSSEGNSKTRAAAQIRRLQNEMQMLLYTHPVNDERQAAGELPINGFWVSGTGPFDAGLHPSTAAHVTALDDAALRLDWPRWQAQWLRVDAALGAWAQPGRAFSLCSDRAEVLCSLEPQNFFTKATNMFKTDSLQNLWGQLCAG
jgi:hypothetical protein